ncbi:uncharacterized protein BHQ10_005825 [Talaromyces amestolkiae]|uniref:Ubiquitin-conjugating enzyme E2 2 n=1 Tax=Talaromyces amestolkiae TaxID=1196081 RepID=A0A364L1X3_TALAM|nr:uncharacterized protein BHQ10_005825 [Talaromyces amestolkiae]RAO69813.1 hypothetical protein BHQ10_005825 [Talaromyces amestolkiae]
MSNEHYQLYDEIRLFMLLIRFKAWGEACGLDDPQSRVQELDDPNLRVTVEIAMMRIIELLTNTEKLQGSRSQDSPVMLPSTNSAIQQRIRGFFKGSTRRTDTHTTYSSINTDTREGLGEIIGELSNSVNDVESVTNTSPAIADRQQRNIEQEIESISDISILERLETARSVLSDTVSDAASIRLKRLLGHSDINPSILSHDPSFRTAHTQLPFNQTNSQELECEFQDLAIKTSAENLNSLSLANDTQHTNRNAGELATPVSPQWRANSKTAQYGSKLESIKDVNEALCMKQFSMPANIRALEADIDNSTDWRRRRLLKDLHRTIHDGTEGFSVSPINDSIYHLRACIEGPPDTPYEDGIFWIDMQIPEKYPFAPPKMRFVTRVYHPNIDSRGAICVDFLEPSEWHPVYKLEQVLLSIISLLAHPTTQDVEEPLVPEIAETYLQDYDLYCQNARKYTHLYAMNPEIPEILS